MAVDFITIDTSNPQVAIGAMQLKTLCRQLRDGYNSGLQILAVMTHMNDGSDFTTIEKKFGLQAGEGQVVFDMVNGAIGSMEGKFQTSDAKNLTERVG
jgi:hypothetical protein